MQDKKKDELRKYLIKIGVEPAKDTTQDPCDIAIETMKAMEGAFRQVSLALEVATGTSKQ
ncbi:hypothetical protein GIKK_72 [Gordonia phage GiKK]|nr:hypothetical protein GIKK_72 [Gordonia phage GiKK]WKW84863.1 hypothetical protein SEA_JAMZY_72 [Gordonia phage Jamzy]